MIRLKLIEITNRRVPKEDNFFTTLDLAVSQKFYQRVYNLFPKLKIHFMEFTPGSSNHRFDLIKLIAKTYIKIIIHNINKRYTDQEQGTNIRRELSKFIYFFNHQ